MFVYFFLSLLPKNVILILHVIKMFAVYMQFPNSNCKKMSELVVQGLVLWLGGLNKFSLKIFWKLAKIIYTQIYLFFVNIFLNLYNYIGIQNSDIWKPI